MASAEYVKLDTGVFKRVISRKEELISSYDKINEDYDNIVSSLTKIWHGEGSAAFKDDADKVSRNIKGIYDILKTMCDTLVDCERVFAECDLSLEEYNQNPGEL